MNRLKQWLKKLKAFLSTKKGIITNAIISVSFLAIFIGTYVPYQNLTSYPAVDFPTAFKDLRAQSMRETKELKTPVSSEDMKARADVYSYLSKKDSETSPTYYLFFCPNDLVSDFMELSYTRSEGDINIGVGIWFNYSTYEVASEARPFEGIINFTNSFIKTAAKEYTTAQYTPRIAGLIAGTPMTISATYAPLSEVIDCDKHTIDENDEKVNKGEFFIWFDGEKFKMSRAMNSLVTTTQDKLEAYQTIKSVDAMDMIYDDIKRTAQDSYIGKYTNDYDNKKLLISAIYGYFRELENARILQKGYSVVDIDAEAVKTYQLKHGLYTKDELAKMTTDEIKQLDTKKQVYLNAKIRILDAMEDIHLDVAI